MTGHRPNKLWGYDLSRNEYQILFNVLYEIVVKIIVDKYEKGYKDFRLINGMALGVDQIFCQLSLKLRNTQNKTNIIVEAAVPCIGQESTWHQSSQEKYHDLLKQCDKITMVTNSKYNNKCMNDRNKYIVNHSNILIAVYDGTNGGTMNCVKYAQNMNVDIIQINPFTIMR